ncbi:MAG: hypothetical protein ACRDQ5_15860 [Sciscionella sp.]
MLAALAVLFPSGLSACGQSTLHSKAADAPRPGVHSTGAPSTSATERAAPRPVKADDVVIARPKLAGTAADCVGLLTSRELRIVTGAPVEPLKSLTLDGGPAGCTWTLGRSAGAAGGFVSVAVTRDDSASKAASGVAVRPTTVEGNTARELTRRLSESRACSYYVRLNDKPAARIGSTLSVTTLLREPAPKASCPVAHRLVEIAFERLSDA